MLLVSCAGSQEALEIAFANDTNALAFGDKLLGFSVFRTFFLSRQSSDVLVANN